MEHLYPPLIPGARIAPFKMRCCHINGSLPDHEDTDCPQDETCSVYVEFYDNEHLRHLVARRKEFTEAVLPPGRCEGKVP